MCVEHLRAIRNVQLNHCVENVAAHTAHFRRVYICRYEGDGGWHITRYKPHVVIDVDPDVLRFWKVVIERRRQQEKTALSALLWEVLRHERQGI